MPIKIQDATVLVIIDGLSLITFNDKKQRCETSFFHAGDHSFSVSLYEKTQRFTGYQPVIDGAKADFEEKEIWKRTGNESFKLQLIGLGTPEISGYKKFETDDFTRLKKSDQQYLNWLVNKKELFGFSPKQKTKTEQRKLYSESKLNIYNGEFFSFTLSKYEYDLKNLSDGTKQNFGKACAQVGAIIKSDAVSFKLTKNGKSESRTLISKNEFPTIVHIRNLDSQNKDIDTDVYYSLFKDTESANKFDLTPIRKGFVGNKVYCHPLGG